MGHISLLFYRATQDRQWGWWVFITPNPVVFHVMASEDKVNIISFGVPDGRSEVLCLSNLENCLIWKVACVLPLCRESPSFSLS